MTRYYVSNLVEQVMNGDSAQRVVELAMQSIPDAVQPSGYPKVLRAVGPRDFEILVGDLAHYLSSHSTEATSAWVMSSYRLDSAVKKDLDNLIKDVKVLLKVE